MIRRILTRLLYTLLSGFIIASALLYALAGTEPGTRWLIATAIRLGGMELHIERSRGSLLGGLDLYGVRWHDASAELNVARIRLRWRPLDLLAGRLNLDQVGATHIFLAMPATTKQTAGPHQSALPRISIPFHVVLKRLHLQDLVVKRGDRVWRIGNIQAHASLHGARLRVSALRISTPQGHLQLIGTATLIPPYSNDVRLAWTWHTADGVELSGHGDLGGDMNRIVLSQRLSAPFPARLQGHFDPRTLDADLKLEWKGAHWPLQGRSRLDSPNGQLIFKGTPDAYETMLKTRIDGPGLPATGITLQAAGDRHHARFTTLQLTTLKGKIDGQLQLSWVPKLRWQLQLHGDGIDPGMIRPAWPGHLAFDLTAGGGLDSFDARLTRFAGTLRGTQVGATAAVRWQKNTLYLSSAKLLVGDNRIQLSGRAGIKRGDLTAEFDLPQIQSLFPAIHGRLRGQGKVNGPWNWPRIAASARGNDLAWNGVRIRRALLDISPAGNDALNARMVLDDVRRDHHTLQHVQAQVTGTPAQQHLTLDADAAEGQFALAAEGGFDADFERWHGELNRLRIAPAQGETWQLKAPSALDVGVRRQKLGQTCLYPANRRGAELCVRFDAEAGRLDATARLKALPLGLINPWLSPEMRLAGHLEGTAELNGPIDALNGQIQAHIGDGELHLNESSAPLTVAFAVPVLQATLHDGALNAKLLTELPKQHARMEAQADIGRAQKNHARPLSGTLRLDLPQLSALQPFIPQLHALSGHAQAQLAFGGTLTRPRLSGTASLDDGSATLVSAGTRLEHVQLHARMPANSDSVNIDARANSGPGSLQVNGQILGIDSAQPRLTAQVSGTNFQAVNLPQFEALISPHLDIGAERSRVKIRGKVEVPQAKIQVHRLPAKTVSISPDVVIVGQTQPKKSGPEIDAEIDVLLGDKVRIDAFGLNGNLTGNLLLRQQNGSPTTANGSLNILNGTYSAYGLNLALSRGVLNFAGPVDNPGLDVVAERKTDTVTAKLSVSGTLQSPRSQISSDPPMSQANALSWLLTGHGINDASRSDTALLLKAVYSMNVDDNGGGLVNQLKQHTGLSEISVQGGNTLQQSALVLGKYLTPDIYVRYTTGLFERMNTLALTYRLTRHLSVEAQSGAAQALDLLYQIDFGGSR